MQNSITKNRFHHFRGLVFTFILFVLFNSVGIISAQAFPAGILDVLNFGNPPDGFLTLNLSNDDRFSAVALQEDGKIVAVGTSDVMGSNDFVVARFNTDGTLDRTFKPASLLPGVVATDFSGSLSHDIPFSVAIQSDGKIVVVGISDTCSAFLDFAVARYTTDGELDPTFTAPPPNPCVTPPPPGVVITNFSNNSLEAASSVAIHPTGDPNAGKIVIAGLTNKPTVDFALVRYCPSGLLDDGVNCGNSGFGNGGRVTTNFVEFFGSGKHDEAHAVAIQKDGKIVAAGFSDVNGTEDFSLVRYHPDGKNDISFGINGLVVTDFSGADDRCNTMALQADGKIVSVGGKDVGGDAEFATIRYCPNGLLDDGTNCGGPGFANGGKDTINITLNMDMATSIALQEDGKIVVAGLATIDSNQPDVDPVIARYEADGDLDPTFNPFANLPSLPGFTVSSISGDEDYFTGVALQKDGKIVAVGSSESGNDQNFLIARFLGDTADLSLSSAANPFSAKVGDTVTYTITVTNQGPSSAGGVIVKDFLSGFGFLSSIQHSQGTCDGSTGTEVVCNLGTLANGASAKIDYVFTTTEAGILIRTPSVTAQVVDPDLSNNSAFAVVNIFSSNPPANPPMNPPGGSPPTGGSGGGENGGGSGGGGCRLAQGRSSLSDPFSFLLPALSFAAFLVFRKKRSLRRFS